MPARLVRRAPEPPPEDISEPLIAARVVATVPTGPRRKTSFGELSEAELTGLGGPVG